MALLKYNCCAGFIPLAHDTYPSRRELAVPIEGVLQLWRFSAQLKLTENFILQSSLSHIPCQTSFWAVQLEIHDHSIDYKGLVKLSNKWKGNGRRMHVEMFLVQRCSSCLDIQAFFLVVTKNHCSKPLAAGLRRYTEGCSGGG